jgi:hypothetical protein
MKKEKRIPTILGLILLIGGVIAGVSLSGERTNTRSKASGDCTPINPQVTNVTNQSIDVSFTTNAQCLANIVVDNRTVTDFRYVDTGVKESSNRTHYFSVNNLKENSEYNFTIISGGDSYNHPNYKVTTGKRPNTSIPTSNLAWGRVFNPDLSSAEGSVVYLNIPGASPLSAIVTSNGNWNISLANSFNEEKNNWFPLPSNQSEDFIIISNDGQATQITGNTSRNNPVPDIIIGQNRFSELPVTGNDTGFIDNVPSTNPEKTLTVSNPQERETIFTSRPDFFGSAPVNSKLTVKIEDIEDFSSEISSETDGTWHWSPIKDIPLGEHTFVINPSNSPSNLIRRKFTVVSQDNVGMAFTASQSAVLPTSTPTLKPSPTKAEPTAVRVSKPSTESGVPKTGVMLPTFLLMTLSGIFFLIAYKRM